MIDGTDRERDGNAMEVAFSTSSVLVDMVAVPPVAVNMYVRAL